jgi:threonine dehydrogenase-like Zn-dependent dehydrogenase
MATASRAVERALWPGMPSIGEGLGPGKVVVVQGSGTIGLLSAIVAKILGAGKVIIIGAPAGRLKICGQFNIDNVINIEEITKPEDRINLVKKLSSFAGGADIVVEATGVPAAVPEGIAMLRPGGTFVEVGHYVDRGTIPINPYVLCSKDINLYGSYGFSQYNMETAIRLLYDKRDDFPFEKIVTHKFSLENATNAVLAAERGEALKSTIVP